MKKIFGIVEGKCLPKIARVIFNFKMSEFVKKNVGENGGRKKNNLPVETQIASRGTGAKAGRLVADSDAGIFKTVTTGQDIKMGFDEFESQRAKTVVEKLTEVRRGSKMAIKMNLAGIRKDYDRITDSMMVNYVVFPV